MKQFTITIRGECPDDVPDDWVHAMAGAAEVQVIEPEVMLEGDAALAALKSDRGPDMEFSPGWDSYEVEFKTMNVTTKVEIKDALHHKYDWYAFDSWTVKQELIKRAQRDANRTRERGMVHAHSGEEQCKDECVLIVPEEL